MKLTFGRRERGALAVPATQRDINRWFRDLTVRIVVGFVVMMSSSAVVSRVDLPLAVGTFFGIVLGLVALSMLEAIVSYLRISLMRLVLRNTEWDTVSGASKQLFLGPIPLMFVGVVDVSEDEHHVDFIRPRRMARGLPAEFAEDNLLCASYRRWRVYANLDGSAPVLAKRVRGKKSRQLMSELVRAK